MPANRPTVAPWLWAFVAAETASAAAFEFADQMSQFLIGETETPAQPLLWATPNRVRLDLPTLRLRDLSVGRRGVPVLIDAPFTLHTAMMTDLAPGHSLVERLLGDGVERLAVTDWRSATTGMRDFTIDTYLADLNVAVDDLGPPVDLIGLCQGGWLSLLYAARFPAKVRALVLAAAPVDTRRGNSLLAELGRHTSVSALRELIRLDGGRMRGDRIRQIWPLSAPGRQVEACRNLQLDANAADPAAVSTLARYTAWDRILVDLPGPYFLQIVEWLYVQNRLVEGGFPALGRAVDLKAVHHPLFLLAGAEDVVAPPEQVFAAADLVATPRDHITTRLLPGGHLEMFLGRRSLAETWPSVARWLSSRGDSTHPLAASSRDRRATDRSIAAPRP